MRHEHMVISCWSPIVTVSLSCTFSKILSFMKQQKGRVTLITPPFGINLSVDSTVPPIVFGWSSVRGGGREDESTEFEVGR